MALIMRCIAVSTLLLILFTSFCSCDEVMLEWHCKCFKTQKDCVNNINGVPLVNFTVALHDKSCRATNLTCYGRHFLSWQQGNRGDNGKLFLYTADYCDDDVKGDEFNDNQCFQQEIDVKVDMVGCYVVNKMEKEHHDFPLVS